MIISIFRRFVQSSLSDSGSILTLGWSGLYLTYLTSGFGCGLSVRSPRPVDVLGCVSGRSLMGRCQFHADTYIVLFVLIDSFYH